MTEREADSPDAIDLPSRMATLARALARTNHVEAGRVLGFPNFQTMMHGVTSPERRQSQVCRPRPSPDGSAGADPRPIRSLSQ